MESVESTTVVELGLTDPHTREDTFSGTQPIDHCLSSKPLSRAESSDSDRQSPAPVGVATTAAAGSPAAATKKARRRDERGFDQVMKSLSHIESVDERLAALGRKYSELLEEHRQTQAQLKNNQRSLQTLVREKEQLQAEHGKVVLTRSKLESLCRELQRQNKIVKDESLTRAREDDEKRKEITTRFQSTINDIQQQMSDHYDKNMSLREENVELANKLRGLIEQYELREKQIDKMIESKQIETQLYDARLQQAALQMSEEREKHLQDKQKLMKELLESQQKMLLMEEQEKALRAQVGMYTEKYEEFQTTLTKSNDVFSNFKSEMEKMSKKIRKLEKESGTWKQKWENSQRALIDVAEQKTTGDKTINLLQTKISKLESLCRALQEERKLHTAASVAATAADAAAAADTAASGKSAAVDTTASGKSAAADIVRDTAAVSDTTSVSAAAAVESAISTHVTVINTAAPAAISDSAAAGDNNTATAPAVNGAAGETSTTAVVDSTK